MAQRDQRRGLFGRHDARQPGGLQRIALAVDAGANLLERFSRHADPSVRRGFAGGDCLPGHVHHADVSTGIDVRQARRRGTLAPRRHCPPSDCARKNERLSSETVRSTLLSFTSGGTVSAPGEKFSTAFIPAATTMLTTAWAASDGTAMTAIAMPSRRTTRLRSRES